MEIDDKENVMENLQAVIDRNMAEAQHDRWANDKNMQTMFIEDAVLAFAIKKDIEEKDFERAAKRLERQDTAILEQIVVAVKDDFDADESFIGTGKDFVFFNLGVELR